MIKKPLFPQVTPPVAIHALKKIIDLENDTSFATKPGSKNNKEPNRNPAVPQSFRETIAGNRVPTVKQGEEENSSSIEAKKNSESFLRIAFINMLLDIVHRSRDAKV